MRTHLTETWGAGRRRRVAGGWVAVPGLLALLVVAAAAAGCGSDTTPDLSGTSTAAPGGEPSFAAGSAVSAAPPPTTGPANTATTAPATTAASDADAVVRPTEATSAPDAPAAPATSTTAPAPDAPSKPAVTITIVYDNTAARPGVRADWGFACLVEGLEKTVLFDTGADGDILAANMTVLGKRAEDIDVIVLSHDHWDHTGGIGRIVAVNPGITMYYPAAFAEKTVAPAGKVGVSLVPVDTAMSPGEGLMVTAPQGSPNELALMVETREGPVVVMGCAHPGVIELVAAASDLAGEPTYAVLGGLHLMSHSSGQVDRLIKDLKEFGIQRCGPSHCTGEPAIAQIRAAFGEEAIEMGAGATITF